MNKQDLEYLEWAYSEMKDKHEYGIDGDGMKGIKCIIDRLKKETENKVPEIKLLVTGTKIIVEINGLPHLNISREDYIGFQSWYETITLPSGLKGNKHCVEIYTANKTIEMDYPNRKTWESILGVLGQIPIENKKSNFSLHDFFSRSPTEVFGKDWYDKK